MRHDQRALRAPYSFRQRVLNIAHRGARAFAPENTLAAFRKAVRLGCDMVELDVHRSRDGQLVVHHDDQLTRCTDALRRWPGRATYFLSDFTCEELQSLDAGDWFAEELSRPPTERQEFLSCLTAEEAERFIGSDDIRKYRSGAIRIPTLREVLVDLAPTEIMVNIELKTIPRMYPGLADDVVALVESLGWDRRVIISSFDHEQLVAVRVKSSTIATAVLSCDRLVSPGRYVESLGADAFNPGCYGDYDSLGFGSVDGVIDRRGIDDARQRRLGVNAWTCNDPQKIVRLVEAGVTGVISDYPNRVRDALDSLVGRNERPDE